jgi:hypothetical protein
MEETLKSCATIDAVCCRPEIRLMKAFIRGLLGVGFLAICGCAADQPGVTVLSPVRPAPLAKHGSYGPGSLVVYTAIVEPEINPDTQFYPHTGYAIYDRHGRFLEAVRNHVGAWDESPFQVSLPAGRYTVEAESQFAGKVSVPVTIQGGRATVVDLQRGGHRIAEM